jgi:hypothetical protein
MARRGRDINISGKESQTVQLAIAFDGITGLLQHNPRLIDPQDDIVREIAAINKKRQKTEADEAERDRLEWFGGLYHASDIGVYVPGSWIVACLIKSGAAIRKGNAISQGLAVGTDRIPLEYDGPTDLAELYARPEFRSRLPVVVQRSRVMRMRPIFRRWRLKFEAEMDEAVLNLDEFQSIVERAGRMGMGDNRKNGYGRFTATVVADATRAEVLGSNGKVTRVQPATR